MNNVLLYRAWQKATHSHDELCRLYEMLQANDLPGEAEDILHATVLVMDTASRIDLKLKAARVVAPRRK
jgi:hypothetical protein